MACLLVGFDSAWTRSNSGAIVGALVDDAGVARGLGLPSLVRYSEAAEIVDAWQAMYAPSSTLVLIDQPTIVENHSGQRPVEGIVCSVVSRRRGGMQPANKGRADMFGDEAPVWQFLSRFGGPADPFGAMTATWVLETYPVLAMISLGWTLPDSQRPAGRLPKYNPERRKTFLLGDWVHVCRAAAVALRGEGMVELPEWIEILAHNSKPTKSDQDRLDACICLITGLHVVRGRDTLLIGNRATGYIVVPDSEGLRDELEARCRELTQVPSDWLRVFRVGDLATANISHDSR